MAYIIKSWPTNLVIVSFMTVIMMRSTKCDHTNSHSDQHNSNNHVDQHNANSHSDQRNANNNFLANTNNEDQSLGISGKKLNTLKR